jgi:hypothetical protein
MGLAVSESERSRWGRVWGTNWASEGREFRSLSFSMAEARFASSPVDAAAIATTCERTPLALPDLVLPLTPHAFPGPAVFGEGGKSAFLVGSLRATRVVDVLRTEPLRLPSGGALPRHRLTIVSC